MSNYNIYKKTPEEFHNTICDTLEQLEEKKVVHMSPKQLAVACAAVVLVFSTLTVGAIELFQWHRAARENFGTTRELEDKLTIQGAALEAEGSNRQQNIEITALQAVKEENFAYFLAEMNWPADLEWNDDTLFEDTTVVYLDKIYSCSANFVGEPDADGNIIVEIQANISPEAVLEQALAEDKKALEEALAAALTREKEKETLVRQAEITLKNIIQTKESAYQSTLVEAQWELAFPLPTEADSKIFMMEQDLPVNGHSLSVDYAEISPFAVKLYAKEEQTRHAVYYSDMELAAVLYEDGSRVENHGGFFNKAAVLDDDKKFCLHLNLQNAVDVDKVRGLIFKENGEEFIYILTKTNVMDDETSTTSVDFEEMYQESVINIEQLLKESFAETLVADIISQPTQFTDLRILYVRYNHVILTDNTKIYRWDAGCNHINTIADLTDYGYDAAQGGDMAMLPGGLVLSLHPTADSNKAYMIDMENLNITETDVDGSWQVPGYEDYKNHFFAVNERDGLAKGVYASEGYETKEGAFVLYSLDGSLEKLELVNLNN